MEPPVPPHQTPPLLQGWRHHLGLAALFVVSGAAGWLFQTLGAPLPWMIGPLVLTAGIFMGASPRVRVPNKLRPVGQIVVATQVGLAFTHDALDMLAQLAPVIVGAALATGVCIFVVAVLLARFTGQSLAQAFLCCVTTSPVEAAAMAISAGVNPMPVILSQTLRLSAVVVILPFGLYAIEGWPAGQRAPVTISAIDPVHIVLLASTGIISAGIFRGLRIPNPNFLGPITAGALLSVSGYGPLPYPALILALAQIVLGTWLGATFRRDFITSALRLTLASVAASLVLVVLCALSAIGIAILSGVDWKTLVLGAAPGGVTEMALTAKFLGQNVVLITTFHLVRIFIFMPNIPWIVRMIARREQRGQEKA